MLSEYQIECPECGYLRALHYRELNSLRTHIECPKCGANKEGTLPRVDEKLSRHLFDMAKNRVARQAMVDGVRRSWIAIAYIVGVAVYTQDAKLVLILIGVFLMIRTANPLIPMMHNQLCYVVRFIQYRQMMDNDLSAILANESKDSDVIHDYEVCSGVQDMAGVKTLDNPYYAFIHWLAAGLRSVGCDSETVEREAIKLRQAIDRAVREHGGKPV